MCLLRTELGKPFLFYVVFYFYFLTRSHTEVEVVCLILCIFDSAFT